MAERFLFFRKDAFRLQSSVLRRYRREYHSCSARRVEHRTTNCPRHLGECLLNIEKANHRLDTSFDLERTQQTDGRRIVPDRTPQPVQKPMPSNLRRLVFSVVSKNA